MTCTFSFIEFKCISYEIFKFLIQLVIILVTKKRLLIIDNKLLTYFFDIKYNKCYFFVTQS